jgi:hypothetical protein
MKIQLIADGHEEVQLLDNLERKASMKKNIK